MKAATLQQDKTSRRDGGANQALLVRAAAGVAAKTGRAALPPGNNKCDTVKAKYRYYSSTLSRHMLPALDKHLPKIGCPTKVEARCEGGGNGWFELVVTGMLGKLVLRGCSWGYRGEGPHATRDVLVKLGYSQHEADALAFNTPGNDVGTGATRVAKSRVRGDHYYPAAKGKVYFRRALMPQVAPGQSYEVVGGRVVLGERFEVGKAVAA